jgi:hypothetical protein
VWYASTVVWLLLVLTCLATYRVTRLLVTDALPLIAIPRYRIFSYLAVTNGNGEILGPRRWGTLGWSLAYLITCPWCMSGWVAAALVGTECLVLPHVPYPWLLWLAAWAVSPNIQAREREDA